MRRMIEATEYASRVTKGGEDVDVDVDGVQAAKESGSGAGLEAGR